MILRLRRSIAISRHVMQICLANTSYILYDTSMKDLRFEWDTEKEQANIRKHGISFTTAALVFHDPKRLEYYDEKHSDTEDRYATIGMVGDVLTVIYTERTTNIRIISARPATANEKRRYWNGY